MHLNTQTRLLVAAAHVEGACATLFAAKMDIRPLHAAHHEIVRIAQEMDAVQPIEATAQAQEIRSGRVLSDDDVEAIHQILDDCVSCAREDGIAAIRAILSPPRK